MEKAVNIVRLPLSAAEKWINGNCHWNLWGRWWVGNSEQQLSEVHVRIFVSSKWSIQSILFTIMLPNICKKLDQEALRLLRTTINKRSWAISATRRSVQYRYDSRQCWREMCSIITRCETKFLFGRRSAITKRSDYCQRSELECNGWWEMREGWKCL